MNADLRIAPILASRDRSERGRRRPVTSIGADGAFEAARSFEIGGCRRNVEPQYYRLG
jgi:hypothetical protein